MEKLSYLERLAKYGVDSAHPGGFALTDKLLRQENISPDTILLDVGCGTGLTSTYIGTHYPCKVVAVDINPQMIEKARQKFTKHNLDIQLIQADIMRLPFRRNSFDLILSESVTAFTEMRRSIREYCRVLKPGGILLEIESTALQPLTANELNDVKTLGLNSLLTKEEWCKMFRDAGFSDVQVIAERPMNVLGSLFPAVNQIFDDFLGIMRRYRKKFGYGVYRCQK